MQRRWKQVLCSLLGVLLLAGSLLTVPAAAAETTAPQTTAAESTDDAKDSGNTRQIVQTLVTFNFGYLPGSDHKIATHPSTSLAAIESALNLLKKGGIINLCIYSGGDTGYEEKEAILNYVKELDSKKWLVIVNAYYNRKNDPPLPVFIYRLK